MSHRAGSLRLLLVLVPALASCGFFAPTVSVDRVGPGEIYEELNEWVLSSGELSVGTRDCLHAFGLSDEVEADRRGALLELHAAATAEPSRVALFALAELSFLIGQEEDDRGAYLASAVYAWHYLLGEEQTEPANPYERRFRWAADLYNGALMRALTPPDGNLRLVDGWKRLPAGGIQLAVDRSGFPWTAEEYPELLPADDYRIHGLTLRLRDAGLGVALIANPDPSRVMIAAKGTSQARAALARMPATLFLRVDGSLADMQDGRLAGTLELYATIDARTVSAGSQRVPLESDFSVVLAHGLNRSPLWKFSLRGLFEGDAAVKENRLLFSRTPQRGRIPVVFVHGTASNPAYWAEMFNVLLNDPVLRDRVQCWFFMYASGNPLLYTAMTLREQLQQTIEQLDPEGTDPDLRRMVLVSHSQGGLISKLMVVDGDIGWLERMLKRPVAEVGFNANQMALLEKAFEFDPLPFVDRVVYISTPHRGSFLASYWISRTMAKFIALPHEVQGTLGTLFEHTEKLPAGLTPRIPTSLDNMRPGNPLLGILAEQSMAEGVAGHSIISIGDVDPDDPAAVARADDGVVEYQSAHIVPVTSEFLVRSPHSCQDKPATIGEVRRILRAHLAAIDGSAGPAVPVPEQ